MPKKLTATSYQKAIICMVLAYISIALMGVFVKYASDELPAGHCQYVADVLYHQILTDFYRRIIDEYLVVIRPFIVVCVTNKNPAKSAGV